MEYTTQMDAARKGIVTPQMKIVAKKEHMAVGGAAGTRSERPGSNLCQQKAHLSEPGGSRQHAAHQN